MKKSEQQESANAATPRTMGQQDEETGIIRSAIEDAITALATLDEGALGFGHDWNKGARWPLRDELISKLHKAISAMRGLSTTADSSLVGGVGGEAETAVAVTTARDEWWARKLAQTIRTHIDCVQGGYDTPYNRMEEIILSALRQRDQG